jgi:serine/threonine-protein kinase HipA
MVKLSIFLNGIKVGILSKSTNGRTSFLYDEKWIQDGFAISRSLPIQEEEYKGNEVSRYFDNLLPDNDQIKKLVAEKFGAESIRSFDLLNSIGRDCVGALSFIPEGEEPQEGYCIDSVAIDEAEIAKRLRGLGRTTPLGMSDEETFRISIAGAQEKTAFLNLKGNWHEPHGLTPTTHIFKSKIGALNEKVVFEDSVDNEWASLFLMKKMGLNTCEAKIECFGDQRVLVVTRFDRKWVKLDGKAILLRVPQEDLCQAFGVGPYQKYQEAGGPGIEKISKFLRGSKNDQDYLQFFKAIIVFDLLYATDGHAKNFSIFLNPDGFSLTPFYDVMSSYFMHKSEGVALQKIKLAMKVGDSGHYAFKRIQRRHYQQTAARCGISSTKFTEIMSELKNTYEGLNIFDEELDPLLKRETLDIILEGMNLRAQILFE